MNVPLPLLRYTSKATTPKYVPETTTLGSPMLVKTPVVMLVAVFIPLVWKVGWVKATLRQMRDYCFWDARGSGFGDNPCITPLDHTKAR